MRKSGSEIYLQIADCVELLEKSKMTVLRHIKAKKYHVRTVKGNGGKHYEVALSSLPLKAQHKYFSTKDIPACSGNTNTNARGVDNNNSMSSAPQSQAEVYAALEPYNKKICDRNLSILEAVGERKGKEAKAYIEQIWNKENPDNTISYRSFQRIRTAHKREGILGICGKYGKRQGKTKISDDLYKKFVSLYVGSRNPESAMSAWYTLRGYALAEDLIEDIKDFPSCSSFLRLVKNREMKQAIVRIREGKDVWKKEHSCSINLNEDSYQCGDVYVGDHGKFDVLVVLPDGTLGRPWISAICDYKSRMILGYDVFYDNPNGDKVIICLKRSFADYGICKKLLFDNGKDYRRKDIGGGRVVRTSELVKDYRPTITGTLGIEMHFAIPYNSQSKPIERVFGIMREYFDKKFPGYVGSDGKKRPDRTRNMERKFAKLKKAGADISGAGFITFEHFTKLVDEYIEIYNIRAFQSGKFANQSPAQVWIADDPRIRKAKEAELAILCASTGEPARVNRNCIRESRSKQLYFGAWMMMYEGTDQKFFLRVDPESPETAYCFEAVVDSYDSKTGKPNYILGKFVNTARLRSKTGLYDDNDQDLENEIRIKNLVERETRVALKDAVGAEVSIDDKIRYSKISATAEHEANCKKNGLSTTIKKPQDSQITPFSHVPAAIEKEKTNGIWDTSRVADLIKREEKIKKKSKPKFLAFDPDNEVF